MREACFKIAWDCLVNKVVHIDQVEQGFENAKCLECGSTLVAANHNPDDRLRATYFRHKGESTCSGESLTHLWAKQILQTYGSVRGAPYSATATATDIRKKKHVAQEYQPAEDLIMERVQPEAPLTVDGLTFIPDLTARLSLGYDLLIEVFVNNESSDEKADFYRNLHVSCLEIDLSRVPSEVLEKPSLFEKYVIYDAPRKWVSCELYGQALASARAKALVLAREATASIKIHRDGKRAEKQAWRHAHRVLIEQITAYLSEDNHKLARARYDRDVTTPGTFSYQTVSRFRGEFPDHAECVDIPVKGELGFGCHRSVWQAVVYRAVVIRGRKMGHSAAESARESYATRGYGKDMKLLAWHDNVPKVSPENLYETIKASHIPIRPICLEAERIVGAPISSERDRPEELRYLMTKEWRPMPKPVCVIRAYLNELVQRSVVDTVDGCFFAKPPEALP